MKTEKIIEAAGRLAALSFFRMKPEALVTDLGCLFDLYGESLDAVVQSVEKALKDVAQERVSVSPLKYDLAQYSCYHFQPIVAQGHAADMRILFKRADNGALEVEMVGNRFFPADIYTRATERIDYHLIDIDSEAYDSN